ncbi:hypothetical protein BC832DRAFT_397907 [Gaertneriomyces semiglobifer]|nr:hypothetical protein BC832DRAFT_397907 [Gaertneriomyces semiglobifer]
MWPLMDGQSLQACDEHVYAAWPRPPSGVWRMKERDRALVRWSDNRLTWNKSEILLNLCRIMAALNGDDRGGGLDSSLELASWRAEMFLSNLLGNLTCIPWECEVHVAKKTVPLRVGTSLLSGDLEQSS